MTGLHEAADRYLAIRRGLGYKLKIEGRMLGQFVGFCHARGLEQVTVAAALAWATAPAGADVSWWAARLTVIREFARFLAAFDDRTEIPPTDLLPRRGDDRVQPHLYSPAEIAALLKAARELAHPLRAATFEAFIGLMAATGIRTGEAMGLDRRDADSPGTCWSSGAPSSASLAWSRCTPRPCSSSRPTNGTATSCVRDR